MSNGFCISLLLSVFTLSFYLSQFEVTTATNEKVVTNDKAKYVCLFVVVFFFLFVFIHLPIPFSLNGLAVCVGGPLNAVMRRNVCALVRKIRTAVVGRLFSTLLFASLRFAMTDWCILYAFLFAFVSLLYFLIWLSFCYLFCVVFWLRLVSTVIVFYLFCGNLANELWEESCVCERWFRNIVVSKGPKWWDQIDGILVCR